MKLFILIIFMTHIVSAEVIGRVAAVVNDDAITMSDLKTLKNDIKNNRLVDENIISRDQLKKLSSNNDQLLNHLIHLKLIDNAAVALKKIVTLAEVNQAIDKKAQQLGATRPQLVNSLKQQGVSLAEYQNFMKSSMERRRVIGSEVASKIIVTNEEITSAMLKDNKGTANLHYQYELAHIFFDNEKKLAQKRAYAALKTVNANNFLSQAKLFSDDQSDNKKYLLGVFKTEDLLASIEKAISGLSEGQVSQVVKSPSGFHIIKVNSKTLIANPKTNRLRAEYDNKLRTKYFESQLKNWLANQRKKSFVKINI